MVARLLIVHHSPTENVRALTEAVLAGASEEGIEGVDLIVAEALGATADQVLAADGYLFGTPANFGYMSGALKHFFDTIFLEAGGALTEDGSAATSSAGKKPYGLWVHGRYDTTGAVRATQSIIAALPWRQAAPVLEVLGEVGETERAAAHELGATLAALLSE